MRWFVLPLLLVVAGVSGCLEKGWEPSPHPCQPIWTEGCSQGYLSLACRDFLDNGRGLRIVSQSDVLLDGFDVNGCPDGIQVEGGCEGCRLELRNGYIRFDSVHWPDSPAPTLVKVTGNWESVVINEVSFKPGEEGIALEIGEAVRTVHISNVRIDPFTLPSHSYGTGLLYKAREDLEGTEVTITDSRFEGLRLGASLDAESVTLRDVSFIHGLDALRVRAHTINATDIHAVGNDKTGLVLLARDPDSSLRLDGVHLLANGEALAVSGNATIQGLDAQSNDVGLWAMPGSTISVRQSMFEGNGIGVLATSASVDARMNWWGSPLGPTVRANGMQTPGPGDSVSGEVEFVPFRALG